MILVAVPVAGVLNLYMEESGRSTKLIYGGVR